MKISIDLHGVLDDLHHVIKSLMSAVIKDNGEVHILTGSTTKRAIEELKELNLIQNTHYTHVQGLPDYLEYKGKKPVGFNEQFQNNEYSDLDWNSAKAQYCRENNIDLHFDDTIEYGDYFTTPFARLWTKNK